MDNFGAIESTDFRVAIINSKRQVNGNLGLAVQLQLDANREINIHVYAKRQTWICTTWPSFTLIFRLLFIASTQNISSFMPVLLHRNCSRLFLSAYFLFWEFSTLVWRLLFAVNLNLNLSILSITEGTIGVYSIAVLSLFSSGISVILILMCGIVVSSSPTVYGFLSSRYCSTIYLRSPVQYGSIQCTPWTTVR